MRTLEQLVEQLDTNIESYQLSENTDYQQKLKPFIESLVQRIYNEYGLEINLNLK